MKRILSVLVLLFAATLGYAQTSTVTGTTVKDGNGNALVVGKWCFGGTCLPVVNGTITSATVPYGTANISITDVQSNPYLIVNNVTINAGTFSWDAFTVAATQTALGPTAPLVPALAGAQYLMTYDSSKWIYTTSWVRASSLNPSAPGLYSGIGVPAFYCTAPCTYTRSDANPASSAIYAIVALPGTISNAWTLQGASTSTIPTGATADYNFLQGSGTTLTDQSGSGNNGTLGASTLAPTWVTGGLAFAGVQNVLLPASLNNSKTFLFAAYFNPITSGVQPNLQYDALISSSLGGPGITILCTLNKDGASYVSTAYSITLFTGGSPRTVIQNVYSGFHVIGVVLGTGGGDLDHVYIDGVEVASYFSQGSSAGLQSSGNMFLGSSGASPWNAAGFLGTMYRFAAYSSQLSSSQVLGASSAMRGDVLRRGAYTAPAAIGVAVPQLHAIGDSITFGQGVSTPWPSALSLTNQPAYTITNWGISGIQLVAIVGSEANRVGTLCAPSPGPAVAIVFAGTNDFGYGVPTAAGIFGYLASETQILKAAGCRVFLATMISRVGNDVNSTAYDVDKNAYDALILGKANSIGAEGVIDFAANPLLGADGANANTTYFQDGVHPTQLGQNLLAAAASNTLNYYFGARSSNPKIVTAATYTMLAGDGYVSANCTANCVITLPDCTGPSGATYTVGNIQSAFTVGVLTGNTSQLINGIAAATPVSVASNSSVMFRDVPNAKTASGCHWEK